MTNVRLSRRLAPGWLRVQICWIVPAVATWLVVSWEVARPQPWRDEVASWSVATRTVPEILALGKNTDGVLVPYYLFLHYWISWWGDSVAAMRIPSMVAMTATAAAVALLTRRFWGNKAGMLAGLLFAVMPAVARYGQEIRGYALATLFATLATLALASALEKSAWWRWVLYSLCVALMGTSHLLSVLLLAGHLVMAIVLGWWFGRWRILWWVLAAAAGLSAILPLTQRGLGQQSEQLNWLDPATPKVLAEVAGAIFVVPLVGGVVIGLAVGALWRERASAAALIWVSALLPVGLLYAYDQLVSPIFVGRYLLFCVPLVCALAGATLSVLRLPLALVAVLAIGALGVPAQLSMRRDHSGTDYRSAAQVVLNNARPGDGIIYEPRDGWQFVDLALGYYLRDRAPRDLLLQSTELQNASLWATECTDQVKCIGNTRRIWVVAADYSGSPFPFRASPTNELPYGANSVIDRYYVPLVTWRVSGITIALFVRPPTV
ncbi:glycosyltransferase family 39 protein [Actinoplanes sp. KI2]|uniref:glycosyltransferase family 39 protein n=1 Tax=Actinoplanes sp. KI2 TaxID=2983315 RepID=UPI0021D58541|nr:glycosyltransferase family 39 protein [Actinoplanes sp. KI2]MCU7724483.1 glycosyltransferase family 39 protein [Actinoplanes sp. KI2]